MRKMTSCTKTTEEGYNNARRAIKAAVMALQSRVISKLKKSIEHVPINGVQSADRIRLELHTRQTVHVCHNNGYFLIHWQSESNKLKENVLKYC